MTAIVPASPAPAPIPPAELAQKLAAFDGMDLIRGTVAPLVVEQAQRHLVALEAFHRPAAEGQIEAWCRMLRGGTAPIEEREFSARLFAIRATCDDLPAWVWSRETLKIAWKICKFFPTAAEVFELLEPVAERGSRGLAQVRLLAAVVPVVAIEPGETVRIRTPSLRVLRDGE